jgi:hypothetical protein
MSIKLIFASTAAFAMVAGTPAFAAKSNQDEQASAQSSGSSATASAGGERKTCRYIDNTESRTKRERLCFTKQQWKAFDKEQAE